MHVGDRVNWRWTPRGGYGFPLMVAGVVVKLGPRRVQIRLVSRVRGVWVPRTRWVQAETLSPRTKIVPELDETSWD